MDEPPDDLTGLSKVEKLVYIAYGLLDNVMTVRRAIRFYVPVNADQGYEKLLEFDVKCAGRPVPEEISLIG